MTCSPSEVCGADSRWVGPSSLTPLVALLGGDQLARGEVTNVICRARVIGRTLLLWHPPKQRAMCAGENRERDVITAYARGRSGHAGGGVLRRSHRSGYREHRRAPE